jgi:plastocyanin
MGVPSSRLRALTRRLPVSRLLATVAVGALGAVALFSGNSGNVASVSAADDTIVTVPAQGPFVMAPKDVVVTPGTTVTWKPAGAAPHDFASDGCGDSRAGACVFDSGVANLVSGTGARQSYSFKFDNPGVYSYYCRIHGAPGGLGQAGTVTVMSTSALIPSGPPPVPASALRPNVSVYVVSPANGATINGDRVNVQLGVNGATPRAPVSGETSATAGHFNLLLDTEVNLANQVQAVAGVTRSNTTSATLENVRPGPHTLTVVWTYDNNMSPQPPITSTLRFTTVAGAAPGAGAGASAPPAANPVVRPPSTGDAGLMSHSSAPWYIASAGFFLLAGAGMVASRKRA